MPVAEPGGVALVTGGNRGLGFEVCRQLAARGFKVAVAARDIGKAAEAARRIGAAAMPLALDVTDEASIAAAVAALRAGPGRLDVLVNNAGINYDTWQRAANADLQEVAATLDTNLLGPWRVTSAFLPLLGASPAARIVMVSSGAGQISTMGAGPPGYQVSKAALNALTRTFAAELAGSGVLVNAVCPGWVATEMGGSGGRPVEDGAAGIVWAATLPGNGPSGGFFRDRKPIVW